MTKEEKINFALQHVLSIAKSTEEKYVLGCTLECAIEKIKRIAKDALTATDEGGN